MNAKPVICVVDDDSGVREALQLLLEDEGFDVESFASAEAFLAAAARPRRCCAVVDLQLQGMDGLQLQQALCCRGDWLPLIFLSGHGSIAATVRAIQAGAVDFLVKPVARKTLLASIEAAARKHRELQQRAAAAAEARERMESLTGREREILLLAAGGMSNKGVASSLGISHRTVEVHKARIMEKTRTQSAVEMAELVARCALAPAPQAAPEEAPSLDRTDAGQPASHLGAGEAEYAPLSVVDRLAMWREAARRMTPE